MGWLPYVPAYVCVSALRAGASVVQVQRWLGHHSAAFTLSTYVHWLDGEDLGEPLALEAELTDRLLAGGSQAPGVGAIAA